MKEKLRPTDDMSTGGVKFDDGKPMFELLPASGIFAVVSILTHGAQKYAARNWEQGMAWSRPFAGCLRHLWKWWRGEKLDEDSKMPHLWHAACNIFFLIEYEEKGTGTDDRPV